MLMVILLSVVTETQQLIDYSVSCRGATSLHPTGKHRKVPYLILLTIASALAKIAEILCIIKIHCVTSTQAFFWYPKFRRFVF